MGRRKVTLPDWFAAARLHGVDYERNQDASKGWTTGYLWYTSLEATEGGLVCTVIPPDEEPVTVPPEHAITWLREMGRKDSLPKGLYDKIMQPITRAREELEAQRLREWLGG